MRRALILLAAAPLLVTGGCAVDGPEAGSVDPMAQMEAQERIRRQTEAQARACRAMDPDSERYRRDCR